MEFVLCTHVQGELDWFEIYYVQLRTLTALTLDIYGGFNLAP